MTRTHDFDVAFRVTDDGRAVVAVCGELDLLGATKLHRTLMDALVNPVTVLDLSACTFLDSSGLRTLLEAVRRSESAGTVFRIAGVGRTAIRVLELSGLLGSLSLFPDTTTALRA